MSKQFVNDVASIAILATCWHEVPMPPLEGEVPNEREAEGFVRKLSKKTPQSARSGCQLPFQGNVINLRVLFQHAQKLVIEFIDNASAR